MTAEPADRAALHMALDAVLDGADTDGGRLDADTFWAFAAMLAQGRGLSDALHEDGLEALRAVPDSPQNTFKARQTRAYHLAFTANLLANIGGLPGQGSLFPVNYRYGVVIDDLLTMLGGEAGTGEGRPQFLTSDRQGLDHMRDLARRRLVGVVRWRMGATGKTREKVWNDLMGDASNKIGDENADPSKLNRWQTKFGGRKGWLYQEAFAAGQAKRPGTAWDETNDELAQVIALALSGQGVARKPKIKPVAKSR